MVKYHKNGKVVVAHEEYLEQEARRIADIPNNGYTEQILLATYPFDSRTSEVEVRIIVDHQYFRTLYATDRDTEHLGEEIKEFSASEESGEPECPLEGSIHKATFMRCSTLANDFFRGEPTALALHLPVTYPRVHLSGSWEDFKRNCLTNSSGNQPIAPLVAGKKYFNRYDDQMAYIRRDEIEQFIFPWLKAMNRLYEQRMTRLPNPGNMRRAIYQGSKYQRNLRLRFIFIMPRCSSACPDLSNSHS